MDRMGSLPVDLYNTPMSQPTMVEFVRNGTPYQPSSHTGHINHWTNNEGNCVIMPGFQGTHPRHQSTSISPTTPEIPKSPLQFEQCQVVGTLERIGESRDAVETSCDTEVIQPLQNLYARHETKKKLRAVREAVLQYARNHRSPLDLHVQVLPDPSVEELVKTETVKLELSMSRKPAFTASGLHDCRKILAILYLMKRHTKIRLLVENQVRDSDLPLELVTGLERDKTVLFLKSRNNPKSTKFRFKKDADNGEFERLQWSVLAFVFPSHQGSYVPHHKLLHQEVLPFKTHQPVKRKGGYGQVYRTNIYASHHQWRHTQRDANQSADACNVFAIKTLFSRNEEAFNTEVRILRRLSKPEFLDRHGSKHLITLFATYEQNGVYNLVFPWAEQDLLGYWKQNNDPPKQLDMARWLAEQCLGLVEGLQRIHHWDTSSGTSLLSNPEPPKARRRRGSQISPKEPDADPHRNPTRLHGRHGDLKPENILWFPDTDSIGGHGVLKITDFGIARFSKKDSRQGVVPNSPTYRSPEYAVYKQYGPACDVWALGCVFLEFATWYCGGYDAVERFVDARLAPDEETDPIESDAFFFITEEDGKKVASVKPCVSTQIDELWKDKACDGFSDLRNILKSVRDEMLIVHSARLEPQDRTLPPGRRQSRSESLLPRRQSSGQVFRSLGDMEILLNRNPESPRRNTFETPPTVPQIGCSVIGPIFQDPSPMG